MIKLSSYISSPLISWFLCNRSPHCHYTIHIQNHMYNNTLIPTTFLIRLATLKINVYEVNFFLLFLTTIENLK